MIAQRVDGIALAAAERKALVASVERATASGIPVTVFRLGAGYVLSTSVMSRQITWKPDELRRGALIELLGGKGKIGVVMHAPGSASTMDRERGFTETMATEGPNIQIVASQYGMSDRSKARCGGRKYPDGASGSERYVRFVGAEFDWSIACDSGPGT